MIRRFHHALAALALTAALAIGAGADARAQNETAPETPTEAKAPPAAETKPQQPPRLKDRGPTGINNPPSGLWGSSPDEQNDRGLPKATGSAYNYTHIAMGAGVIACAGIALIVLIRRFSTAGSDTP